MAARTLGRRKRLPRSGILADETWRADAACLSRDTDRFYRSSELSGRISATAYDDVRPMCEQCPVVDRCALEALASGETYGLWGGLDPMERRTVRRELPNDVQHAVTRRHADEQVLQAVAAARRRVLAQRVAGQRPHYAA